MPELNARQAIKDARAARARQGKIDAQGLLLRHEAYMGSSKLVALLGPSRKASPDTPDEAGWAPLHYACMANKAIAVQQLMAKGANLNATTSKGWTPLHVAAYHGSLEAAAVLIDGCEDLEADELEDGTRPRLPGVNLDAITSGGHLGSPGLTPLALALKWGRVAMVKLIREKDGSGGVRGNYKDLGFYQVDTSWMTKNSRADSWEAGEEDPNAFKAYAAKPKPAEKGLKLKMAFGGVASYLKAKEHAEEEHNTEGGGGGKDGAIAHDDDIDDQALWAAAGDEARAKAAELAAARLQTPEDIDNESGISEGSAPVEEAGVKEETERSGEHVPTKLDSRPLQLPPIGEGIFDAAAHSSRRESVDLHHGSSDGAKQSEDDLCCQNVGSNSDVLQVDIKNMAQNDTQHDEDGGDGSGDSRNGLHDGLSNQQKLPPLSPRLAELPTSPALEIPLPVEVDSSCSNLANDLSSANSNNHKSAEQVAEERAVLEKKIATARKKLRRAGPDDPGLAEGMQAAIDGLESKLLALNQPLNPNNECSSKNGGSSVDGAGAENENVGDAALYPEGDPALASEKSDDASGPASLLPSPSLSPLSGRSTTPPLARIQRSQSRRMPRGVSKPLSKWDDEVLLRKAAGDGDLTECHRLLGPKSTTDVNAPDESGGQRTALHCAADKGHAAVVKYLCMEAQASLDPKTAPYGHTPLHLAAENNCWPVVQALLAAGANATATNLYGETARDIAAANGHTKVLEALPDISTGRLSTGRSSSLKRSQSKKVKSFRGSQRIDSTDSTGRPSS